MSYKGVYDFFGPAVRRFFNIRVSGTENEPEKGPFIVCANHLSDSDPIILDAALHHQLRYFAKEELFRIPLFRRLIIALGAYPVRRGMSDVRAIRKTVEILENGEVVGMFREPPSGQPPRTDVKSGVGMIAWRAKSPVLPELSNKGWKISPFKRVNAPSAGSSPLTSSVLPRQQNRYDNASASRADNRLTTDPAAATACCSQRRRKI